MKLQVLIVCPTCSRTVEVHVYGAWDIKTVKHNCTTLDPGEPRAGRQYDEPIRVEFDPPRRPL